MAKPRKTGDTKIRYTPAVRAKCMERLHAGKGSIQDEAERIGCSGNTIRGWVESEGYDPKDFTRAKLGLKLRKTNGQSALPTKPSVTSVRKPQRRGLIAEAVSCPHCGGGLDLTAPVKVVNQ